MHLCRRSGGVTGTRRGRGGGGIGARGHVGATPRPPVRPRGTPLCAPRAPPPLRASLRLAIAAFMAFAVALPGNGTSPARRDGGPRDGAHG